ncbi:MAG TPA: N-acetylmuramoyl-L-alanine amidase [Thermoanaerobaculia bacterium]|jgi:N-acetylmuramoyl-L-alanine amidase
MRFLPRASSAAAGVLLCAATLLAAQGREKTVVVSPEIRVTIGDGDEITLSARPLPGEGIDAFVRRLTDDPKTKKEILAGNGGLRRVRDGGFVRVPYRLLSDNYRKIAIGALFPADRAAAAGWEHRVAALTGKPESLWRVAEWLTGDGANYREIRQASTIPSLEIEQGQTILVPARLLTPAFREAVAAAAPEPPALEFSADEKGRYAIYRLRKGEALYSAVVVRFTGRLHAEDVNAKAAEIAERSGIENVHAIPVGFPIKIPIADLDPRFRLPDDPERIAEENARLEASQFANKVKTADLSGVTLVLDAGHGGRDTGAIVDGIEEAAYVYDIACRIERLIKAHTRARLIPTVGRDAPCSRSASEVIADSRSARVLTTPPYPIEDAAVGVNFRWYLANSVLKHARRDGSNEDRTVFLSLHADSLHPAVRGAMVYVPGEKFLNGSFGKAGQPYTSRREVKEAPSVSFSRREKIQAEGISRDFAERIVAAFRSAGLPLHAFDPIRGNVIRSGREWVPAILRYNRIPARVLVEICNLNNPEDRKLLRTRVYREKVAEALVNALVDFYGGSSSGRLATAGGLGSKR